MSYEGKVVRVLWTDSGMHLDHGWAKTEVYQASAKSWAGEVETIGTVLHDGDGVLVVGLSQDRASGNWYGAQLIWKVAINELNEMRVGAAVSAEAELAEESHRRLLAAYGCSNRAA